MAQEAYVEHIPVHQSSIWKKGQPLLGRLDIEVTERCNNNCIHCNINRPLSDENARRRELTASELKEILVAAVTLGCLDVRYTGGEPLVREDFEEIYLFTRRLGMRVYLFSNATLIDDHWADLLARVPPLEPIEITLYGMTRQSYEGVSRAPGTYEAAWAGVRRLQERNVPFIVKGTILPPNKHEREDFIEWAKSLPWMDDKPSFTTYYDLRARRDSDRRNRLIKRLRLTPAQGMKALGEDKESYKEEMREFCAKFIGPQGDKLYTCGAGIRSGTVDAKGYFQPCLATRNPEHIYNLRDGSLRDALTHFFPEMREIRAANPEYLRRCAVCFLKGLCEQCPAKSYMEHGTPDTPVEYLCDIAHHQARRLGLLEEGEKSWEVTDWQARMQRLADNSGAALPKLNRDQGEILNPCGLP